MATIMEATGPLRIAVIDVKDVELVDVEDAASLPPEPEYSSKRISALVFLLVIFIFFVVLVVSLSMSSKSD